MSDFNNKSGDLVLAKLDDLYLDPNNYRFINDPRYVKIEKEGDILNDRVQKRTSIILRGNKNEGINDLITSFKTNGFLSVDQIQAKPIGETGKYLILEGNRRIATLKYLKQQYVDHFMDIGNLNPAFFTMKRVPIVTYDLKDESHFYVVTGLKHIEGNKKWPTINQAKLVKDLIAKFKFTEDEVVEKLGSAKYKIRRYLRALSLVDEYKKSDYGDQFNSEMYSIFEEIIKNPRIRGWLDWDEDRKVPNNKVNMDRLFSWISNEEETEDESKNKIKRPKIIEKAFDVRKLGQFINDDKALDEMEETRSLNEGYLISDQIYKDKFNKSLDVINTKIIEAFSVAEYSDESSREKLQKVKKNLEGLLVSKGFSDILNRTVVDKNILVSFDSHQLESLKISKFKNLENLEVKKLNKVNIFAGINNSGKTTLLEAIYTLVNQNNVDSFFDTIRRRGKFERLNSVWLNTVFNDKYDVNGIYNGKELEVVIWKGEEEDEDIDKSDYLNTIFFESKFSNILSESKVRIYENKAQQSYTKKINVVCNSSFSSPFSLQDPEIIFNAHSESIQNKSYSEIIKFIQENFDGNIENIQLSEYGGVKRFDVTNKDSKGKTTDLTQYGDGLQRIFLISLQFAAAINGVLLIDELENAIHYSLLVRFSELIQKLSNRFNVQVFITSHSNECIEAFVNNDMNNEDIMLYQLSSDEHDNVSCEYVAGNRYKELVDLMGVDLRKPMVNE